MARRATLIESVRAEADHPVLVLDAGGSLLGQQLAYASEGRVMVAAMDYMGYDAMTVGLMDLARGIDVLLERAAEASFAVLSANLVGLDDDAPLLEPYVILEREGLRVGIIGLTEPDAARAPGVEEAARVLDPHQTLARYLPQVMGESDLVVVLSHLGLDEDRALAEAFPDVDVIVGGRSRQLMRAPEFVGNTAIVQMGYDGEWVGRLDVVLADARLHVGTQAMLSLGPEVPDDPEMLALVERYREQYAE